MNLKERTIWFKTTFGEQIQQAVAGTPLSVDLITAIALQETGYLWSGLVKHHQGDIGKVLEGCVGDTLDFPRRRAFPKNKTELLSWSKGAKMFKIGRAALAGLADINATYRSVFQNDKSKFCRGYGILQYDLQHIKTDPDFFLKKQWADFDTCLSKCLKELRRALKVRGFQQRQSLTNFEAATVAIVYNRGRYDATKKLKQGHFSNGKYYGEYILEYIELAQSIDVDPDADGGNADAGEFEVVARNGLNLRGGPGTEFSVLDTIEFGSRVDVLDHETGNDKWALVDLNGDGLADGFMHASFLREAGATSSLHETIEDMLRSASELELADFADPLEESAEP